MSFVVRSQGSTGWVALHAPWLVALSALGCASAPAPAVEAAAPSTEAAATEAATATDAPSDPAATAAVERDAPPPVPVLVIGELAPPFRLPLVGIPTSTGTGFFASRRYLGSTAEEPCLALVVTFGASYCGPCKKELPALDALVQRYASFGARGAVVSIDREADGIQKMRELTQDQLGLSIPLLWDRFNIVARRYGADTLPFVVLVDGAGRVRWFHGGYAPETMAALEAELRSVVDVPPKRKRPKRRGGARGAAASGVGQ